MKSVEKLKPQMWLLFVSPEFKIQERLSGHYGYVRPSIRPSVRPSVQIACEQHICRTIGVTITKFGMKLEGHELLT